MSNFKHTNKYNKSINRHYLQGLTIMHSIAIITDDHKFREFKYIQDALSQHYNNSKAVLIKSIGKRAESSENERFYMLPFLTKDQVSNLKCEDQSSLILETSPNLFSIVYKQGIQHSITENSHFVNQEPIAIAGLYCGVPTDSGSPFIVLPSCPVCLKRLDKSVSGLDTIKCRDLFHSCCQENCKRLSSECLVCRILFEPASQQLNCSECASSENLWICLICANLGCGRYKGGHAHDHFLSSGHSFALKLDSHHIWDYSSDKYVHWSIKSDQGTAVDIDEDSKPSSFEVERSRITQPVEDFVNDFTTAQLESQKDYFEDRLACIKNEHYAEIVKLKATHNESVCTLKEEINRLNHERSILSNLSNQYQDQIKKLRSQCGSLTQDLETERKISKGLAESVDKLNENLQLSIVEKQELEEQVKDLMKHIEVLDLMGKAGNIPEIVEGKLLIRPLHHQNHNKKKATK